MYKEKKTPVPAHKIHSSLNRKQILLITDYFTPCMIKGKIETAQHIKTTSKLETTTKM